jgi:5-methylcytosine-specific restriction protein B
MQGFRPKEGGEKEGVAFELRNGHFIDMCEKAQEDPGEKYVLVIDELSRGDAARVFGEALTYLEKTKRGLTFDLASGQKGCVPENLVILATMNPLDRGVDEVDAAFGRRFAQVSMEPSGETLEAFMEINELPLHLAEGLRRFFRFVNKTARTNPQAAVGHVFFSDVNDEESLRAVWDYQLVFQLEKAFRLDQQGFEEVQRRWEEIFPPAEPETLVDEASAGEEESGEG